MNSTYKTKDLNLAAYIYSSGINLLKFEREGKVCWFYFDKPEVCEQLAHDYWNGQTPIKSFVDANRTLKDMIFAK